jgi:hypothetical protein
MDYGRVTARVAAHEAAVSCLALQGDTLLSGSWDSYVKVWAMSSLGASPSQPGGVAAGRTLLETPQVRQARGQRPHSTLDASCTVC